MTCKRNSLGRTAGEEAALWAQNRKEGAHDAEARAAEAAHRAAFERENPSTLWGNLKLKPLDWKMYGVIKWSLTYGASWKRCGWGFWGVAVLALYFHMWWLALLVWVCRTRGEIEQRLGRILRWGEKKALLPVSFVFAHARGKVDAETHIRRQGFCNSCGAVKRKDIRVWVWRRWWPGRDTVNREFCRGRDLNQQDCACPDTRASANEHRIGLVNVSCIMGKWPRGNTDENKLEGS